MPTRIGPRQSPPDARLPKEGKRSQRVSQWRRRTAPSLLKVAGRASGYRWYPPCKRVLEVLAALTLFLIAGPVILILGLLVRSTSPGPAFYTQVRVGRHGRLFRILKLRTMIHKCESLTGPRWSMPGDPRITWLGRLLRGSHLDELPQLVNVLRGDMSLIGPRPERPEFMPELEETCLRYRDRLAVRPGITGLAQVQLPADTSVASVRRKLAYDLYYIHHLGPWLDLSLLAGTLFYALGVPFSWVGPLFRIPSGKIVEKTMVDVLQEREGDSSEAA